MSEIKDGGPAFPSGEDITEVRRDGSERSFAAEPGMSLRDYFAAKAMQGLCSNEGYNQHVPGTLANEAYVMADAMLRARGEA
ncbi:hypothetical protein [Burkholderia cepacia]|uniref:hypothetical protein n=1 Tax=Burkholderia cepacia TaxID=292 RepID=UPI001CF351D7|nr:hypothetical protein [Burkholderia cepacia]MCA8323254.1 hypothetical protein [Burkholderia cepacia]